MPYNPNIHHRRSIRLPDYDYTQAGAYFVTLVAQGRECLLGTIHDGVLTLSPPGEIVAACWQRLPAFSPIRLDAWVVMPNHFHGIVVIDPRDMGRGEAFACSNLELSGTLDANASPSRAPSGGARSEQARMPHRPDGTRPASLGAIVQNFKSVSTRFINQARQVSGVHVWQRNYYEHIIRDDREWERIRQYIHDNPVCWEEDREYVR